MGDEQPMNLNNHKQWRDGVISHYGSIANFGDARTVRIMLGWLNEIEAEFHRIKAEIKSRAGREEWAEAWATEMAEMPVFKKELEDWLKARKLERV